MSSELFDFNQSANQDGFIFSLPWSDRDFLDNYESMSTFNESEDPIDINDLLDVGNASDVIPTIQTQEQCPSYNNVGLDHWDHEDWCEQHLELQKRMHQTQVEHELQNKQLAKENEADFMEAMQSLDNQLELFQTNYNFQQSDSFACLGSALQMTENLNHPMEQEDDITFLTTPLAEDVSSASIDSSSLPADDANKISDNESMLKQLLLNPCQTYPKEVDSGNSGMEHNLSESVLPKAPSCSGELIEDKKQSRKMKKKKKVAKKPFTELLKHLETPKSQKPTGQTKPITKLVNVNRYMRQYCSAPPSRVASPTPDAGSVKAKKALATKRLLVQAKVSAKNAKAPLSATGKKSQITKVYPISNPSSAMLKSKNSKESERVIVAPDADSLLDMFEVERAQSWKLTTETDGKPSSHTTDKRRGTVLIDPLPNKRLRSNEETKKNHPTVPEPENKQCTERPSADHDYCQQDSSKAASAPQDVLSAAIQASGLARTEASGTFEVPASKPPATNKVLKWEEYLQRVRLGTRSAPNSPTTSPKIVRGSARPINNFMVTTSTAVVKQKPSAPVSQLVDPIAAIKAQTKVQNPMKLQEFQEYLAKLQSCHQANATGSLVGLNNVSGKLIQVSQTPISLAPATVTVAASSCRPVVQQSRPIAPSQPFIKIHSGGKVHTAAVTSSQTNLPANKPLVMIRIPTGSSSTNVVGLPCVATTQKPPVPKTVVSAVPAQVLPSNNPPVQQLKGDDASVNESVKDPRILAKKPKPLPTVLKPISREKWNSAKSVSKPTVSAKSKIGGNSSGNKASDPSPTFKLITSNKGGVETKSLILSGVTGQLKHILTLLAQQQQQQGKVNEQKETSNLQQQKNLQQLLLATITNMKSKQSNVTTASVSPASVDTRATLSSSTLATRSRVTPIAKTVKKNMSVPSPLSLIHEIKQNMSKKSETLKTTQPKPHFVYTVPAAPTARKVRTLSKAELLSEERREFSAESLLNKPPASVSHPASAISAQPQSSVTSNGDMTTCGLSYPLPTVLPKLNAESKTSTELELSCMDMFVDRSACPTQPGNVVSSTAAVSSRIPVIINQQPVIGTDKQGTYFDEFTQLIVKDTLEEICDKVIKNESRPLTPAKQLLNHPIPVETMTMPAPTDVAFPAVNSHGLPQCEQVDSSVGGRVVSHKPEEISICRSMAAAEMMADDIIESNREEVLVFTLQQPQISTKVQSKPDLMDAADSIGDGSPYYNKLPAYLYSGKMLATTDRLTDESNGFNAPAYQEGLDSQSSCTGLKELSNDPLIGNEFLHPETSIQYNKLPHYFSSGKLGPRENDDFMPGSSGEIAHEVTIGGAPQSKDLGFSTKLKCTPDGSFIDTDDTFYSRLPSYYNYGRTHVVDTVTEPPDEPDDVVTEETLERQREERKSRRERKKRKKKRRKHRKSNKRQDGDKILYSKLPSYLLSGRKQLAPERGSSEHSYSSSRTLSSDSERDSRSRSPLRRRRSYRRSYSPKSDRSFSRSSSRSRSRSPKSPRRSWRGERNSRRSDYSSSYHRERDRYSSESDHRTSRSRYRRRRSSSTESDWNRQQRQRWEKQRQEKQKTKDEAIRQRRVMYVGGITESTSKEGLQQRFCKFGEIDDVALHFRNGRDSYAFVTFRFSCDATAAIERGNEGDVDPTYVLCYGGRRQFCQVDYADLDEEGEPHVKQEDEDDFDTLLRQAMRRS